MRNQCLLDYWEICVDTIAKKLNALAYQEDRVRIFIALTPSRQALASLAVKMEELSVKFINNIQRDTSSAHKHASTQLVDDCIALKNSEEQALREQLAPEAWYALDDIHLTLAFIGLLPVAQIAVLWEAIQASYMGIVSPAIKHAGLGQPVILEGRHLGLLPYSKPRLLVWMMQQGASLASLYDMVQKSLLEVGIVVKPGVFRPHLSLLRLTKALRSYIINSHVSDISLPGDVEFDRLCLYASLPQAVGRSYYHPLAELQL